MGSFVSRVVLEAKLLRCNAVWPRLSGGVNDARLADFDFDSNHWQYLLTTPYNFLDETHILVSFAYPPLDMSSIP